MASAGVEPTTLWLKVIDSTKASSRPTNECASDVDLPISVEEMNRFYAAASTDDNYLPPVLKTTATPIVATCLDRTSSPF